MIYDLDGIRRTSSGYQGELNVPKIALAKIECRTGYKLSCVAVADLTVEARKQGSGTWLDIETTPIDLSADDGNLIIYEFRLTPTAYKVRQAQIRVGL